MRSQVEVFVHMCYHSKSTLGDTVQTPGAPPCHRNEVTGTLSAGRASFPEPLRPDNNQPRAPGLPRGEKDFVLPSRTHPWVQRAQWPLPHVTGVFSSNIILIRTQFPLRLRKAFLILKGRKRKYHQTFFSLKRPLGRKVIGRKEVRKKGRGGQ